jgi:hypothetical protein
MVELEKSKITKTWMYDILSIPGDIMQLHDQQCTNLLSAQYISNQVVFMVENPPNANKYAQDPMLVKGREHHNDPSTCCPFGDFGPKK